MLFEFLQKTAPTVGSPIAKPHGIVLPNLHTDDDEHQYFKVTRYTSSANALLDVSGTDLEEDVYGSRYKDDNNLTADTPYWYRVHSVDRWFNASAKSTPVTATYRLTQNADTDQRTPNLPTSLSITALTTDIDADGDLDAGLSMSWVTGATDSTHPAAEYFEVQIFRASTNGGTYTLWETRMTASTTLVLPASVAKYHKFQVSGRTFNSKGATNFTALTGNAGNGVKPNVKPNDVATPSAPTVVTKARNTVVKWTRPTAPDHLYMKVWRYDGSVSTPGSAVFIGIETGNRFVDPEPNVGQQSWYYLSAVDTSANESSKSTGTTATMLPVAHDDTDQAAIPSTPPAPTLSQYTADIDDDGKVDTGIAISMPDWTGVPVKFWEVELQRSATLGGTYTQYGKRQLIPAEEGSATVFSFDASPNKYYKARYRGVSVFGKKGSFSLTGNASGIQPLRYSSSIPTPTLTVTPKAKGMFLSWTKWQNKLYLESVVYRDTVEIWRGKANSYVDNEELVVGQSYSYTVQHIDKQDQAGSLSSPNAKTYRAAAAADLPTETSQLVFNPSFENGLSDGWTLSSLATVKAKAASGVPANARSAYVLQVQGSTAGNQDNYWGSFVPVEPGEIYYVEAVIEADATVTHSLSIGMNFRDGSLAGNNWITGVTKTALEGQGLSAWTKVSGLLTVPATASGNPTGYGRFWFSINSNTPAAGNWFLSKLRCRKATESDIIALQAIQTQHIKPKAVTAGKVLHTDPENMVDDGSFEHGDWADVWTVNGGTSGTNFYISTFDSLFGGQGLMLDNQVTNGASGGTIPQLYIESTDYLPVKPSDWLAWEITRRTAEAGGSSIGFYYRIVWYKRNKTASATPSTDAIANGPVSFAWATNSGLVQVPSDAAYCKIRVIITNTITTRYCLLDRVSLRKAEGADLVIAGGITRGHTDPTAPGTPGIPSFTQIAADLDGDGTQDCGLQVTITAGTNADWYEVEIWDADTVGTAGSMTGYTFLQKFPMIGLTQAFKANGAKFYKACARGKSFNNVTSLDSAFTSVGVQPLPITNTMPTVTWPVTNPIKSRPKGIALIWNAITTTYKHAKEIVIYRHTANASGSAVEIDTVPANSQKYVDQDANLVVGTTYFYWLKVRDKVNNVSSAFSAVQSVTFRTASAIASDGDFDTTALAAPTGQTYTQDTSFDINGDGKIDMIMKLGFGSVVNATAYEVEISRSTTLGGTYTVIHDVIINSTVFQHECNVKYFYKARARALNAYSQPGAWTTLSTGVQPAAKGTATIANPTGIVVSSTWLSYDVSWNLPADKDYLFSEVAIKIAATTPTSSDIRAQTTNNFVNVFWPSGTTANYYIYVRHWDRSHNPTAWVAYGSPTSMPTLDLSFAIDLTNSIPNAWMQDDSINTAELVDNAVTNSYTVLVAGNVSLAAATETSLATLSGIDCTDVYKILAYVEFINNDGTVGRNFDVNLYDNTTQFVSRSGINTSNQGPINLVTTYTPGGSGTRSLTLKAQCPSATTIKNPRIIVVTFKR